MMRPVCKHCHSTGVMLDSYAEWSIEKQSWVLSDTFDFTWCADCNGETTLIWEAETNEHD